MKEWTSIVDLCQRYTKSAYFALKLKQLASRYVHRAEALFFIKVCPFIYDTGLYANTPCIIMFERTIIASIFIVLSLHMFRWETEELGWAHFSFSKKWKIAEKKRSVFSKCQNDCPMSAQLTCLNYKVKCIFTCKNRKISLYDIFGPGFNVILCLHEKHHFRQLSHEIWTKGHSSVRSSSNYRI